MIAVERHQDGPRLRVAGVRIHHGSAGAGAILLAIPVRSRYLRAALVVTGAIALWHDRHDFPFRDTDNH